MAARTAPWGVILTIVTHRRHLGGAVMEGVCRDSLARARLPDRQPVHLHAYRKDRVQMAGEQVRASLGGARVRPGDLLLGDAGVVVAPAERAGAVPVAALEIEAREEAIRALVPPGTRRDEACRQHRRAGLSFVHPSKPV